MIRLLLRLLRRPHHAWTWQLIEDGWERIGYDA